MIAKSSSGNGSSVMEKDDAFWGNAIIVYGVTIFTVKHISYFRTAWLQGS